MSANKFATWVTIAAGVVTLWWVWRSSQCNCSSNPAPKDFTSDLYL